MSRSRAVIDLREFATGFSDLVLDVRLQGLADGFRRTYSDSELQIVRYIAHRRELFGSELHSPQLRRRVKRRVRAFAVASLVRNLSSWPLSARLTP